MAPTTTTAQHNNADNLVDDPHGLAIYEEKPNIDHLESGSVHEKEVVNSNADYSGFTQKTDPKEIRLVRKLDLYIMVRPPRLWHPRARIDIASDLPLVDVLAQLP